jgi:formylglycine-generating enzyme required for sulfatase activity
VGKYPVTFEEYNLFCTDIGKKFRFLIGFEKQPVVNIDWNDANQYCEWLSDKIDKEYKLINSNDWQTILLNNYIKIEDNIYEWCKDGYEDKKKLKISSEIELFDLNLKNLKIGFRYNILS